MTTTLFTELGLRSLPEGAAVPEPTVIVTDVDWTRDTITGELRIEDYTVTVSQSFKTDRMGLYEFNQKLSNQAEEIAQAQALKQSRP